MITVVCSSQHEELLQSLGARIVAGRWTLNMISHEARRFLESNGALIEGCKYKCWNTWYPNIYGVTKDSRCTVSFNTLTKRAVNQVELDKFVVGRAQSKEPSKRKNTYGVTYLGKFYPSETALAREFNLKLSTFRSRRQLGWSLEDSIKELR